MLLSLLYDFFVSKAKDAGQKHVYKFSHVSVSFKDSHIKINNKYSNIKVDTLLTKTNAVSKYTYAKVEID